MRKKKSSGTMMRNDSAPPIPNNDTIFETFIDRLDQGDRTKVCAKIFASFQHSLLKFNAVIAAVPPPLIDFEIIAGQHTLYFFNLYGDKI